MCFFVGQALERLWFSFLHWYRLSPLHLSFGQELVRLIALTSPVTVLNNVINPKSSKNFSGDFSMACRQQMRIFGIFKACISTFVYYNLYKKKLKVITRKKYTLHFMIRPLDFLGGTREDSIHLMDL